MFSLDLFRKELAPRLRRLRLYGDLSMVARILKFKPLRARFLEKMWQDASAGIGADFCLVDGQFVRISKGTLVTYVRGNDLMLDSSLMLDLMGNKAITLDLLKQLEVPVPRSVKFSLDDTGRAISLLEECGTVVIKPVFGTGGGRGVTTGISSVAELRDASSYAARFDKSLVAEEQVNGSNYRLLYLDGEFVDAVRRDPPSVWGDGKSTIKTLVAQENKRRLSAPKQTALSPLVVDRDAKLWLNSQGINVSDIPDRGKQVRIKRAVNENNRRENLAVGHKVSVEIREECSRICRALGIRLAGIDLYAHNISGKFDRENCIIGEINTTPGLHHHYLVANPGSGVPVAQKILEHLFENHVGLMELQPVTAMPEITNATARDKVAFEAGAIKTPKVKDEKEVCHA